MVFNIYPYKTMDYTEFKLSDKWKAKYFLKEPQIKPLRIIYHKLHNTSRIYSWIRYTASQNTGNSETVIAGCLNLWP